MSKYIRKYKNYVRGNYSGFTLIEILIVITIVSLLASMSASVFISYNKQQKIKLTKARLDQIHESIQNFLEVNGRYPCPAPFTLIPTDANFGIEGDSDPTSNHSCQQGFGLIPFTGSVGAFSANPSVPFHVQIGVLPVRTLNLPDEYAVDAWGGLLTYAVARHLATEKMTSGAVGFSNSRGNIRILDNAGNTLINPPNSAHYIVLSHGEDQNGARVLESNNINHRKNPCGALQQAENCDDDAVFSLSTWSTDVGADTSDDIAIFETQRHKDNVLDRGTIIAFALNACPQGWVDYMNTTERGGFLLGVDPSGASPRDFIRDPGPPVVNVAPKPAPANVVSRGVSTGEYGLNNMGERGEENIPAYLSLRYCIKQ